MQHSFIDLTGRTFGALRVIELSPVKKGADFAWRCLCKCGKETTPRGGDLRSGATQSCGCVKDMKTGDRARSHGMSKTSTYGIWQNMHTRCTNAGQYAYKNYGARGITICKRWFKFENFLADMGERPEGLSLERRENDKGYSKGNCYWATRAEQARNRRDNKWLTANGETLVQSDWARRLGITAASLKERLDNGWTVEAACTTPKQLRKHHGI